MNQRGKFLSLTMVNWNGFFARTFDIDRLVTTLSGGNGAGKSTTMAAFITAMIPDQSLLHFRNTTEAGSSNASRDKGLHGKLKPGACYAVIDVKNSLDRRIVFGVRLVQIAGRDKKVDIKPFILQGLDFEKKVSELFIESIGEAQARIKQFNDIKEDIGKNKKLLLKSYNSVTDYHSDLFDLGILPKKLRNTADRAKFYRLIEASLYGGISSAITKSLRDYLLPQNSGVKKAFQDMETALRENRATLEAIRLTQRDRNLFKHLISESTNYVASDYMRHTNERRKKIEATVALRYQLSGSSKNLLQLQSDFAQMNQEQNQLIETQETLEQNFQQVAAHLQQVNAAVKQQEKILRYQEELAVLIEKFDEQAMVVEEATEQLSEAENQLQLNENEVDSLKSQLADYQQALNTQQTHALLYQQAVEALNKARSLTALPLDIDNASSHLQALKQQESEQTTELLAIKHKLDLLNASAKQFEQGLNLVRQIAGEVPRSDVANKARALLSQSLQDRQLVQSADPLLHQRRELEIKKRDQQQVIALSQEYQAKEQAVLSSQDIVTQEQNRQQEKLEHLEMEVKRQHEQLGELARQEAQIQDETKQLEQLAPKWIAAQNALEQLSIDTQQPLDTQQAVLNALQASMLKERQLFDKQNSLSIKKDSLEDEIERLNQPGGNHDARLQSLADSLGGTLLSEIYEDISLSDAPYFSALYGPARHAIVVPELKDIESKLSSFEDCPEDLYIIEGDAGGFDDSVYQVKELENAVCVQLNERQLRFSRFPAIPLFGRAAREHRLAILREDHKNVKEEHAKIAFDAQKWQRINQRFNDFVAKHLQIAFHADPEAAMKTLREKRSLLGRESAQIKEQGKAVRNDFAAAKSAMALLVKILPLVNVLEETDLALRIKQLDEQIAKVNSAKAFLQKHNKALNELERFVLILETDPEQADELKAEFTKADEQLRQSKQRIFALADLIERAHHFSYQDAESLLDKSNELSEQLKIKLVAAEQARGDNKARVKQIRQQHNDYEKLLASLKSAHQAKQETLQEFQRELASLGVKTDEISIEQATAQRDELSAQLAKARSRKSELDKSITLLEIEIKSENTCIKKAAKEYKEQRKLAIKSKANWVGVLKIARDSQVEKLLNRREMAYMPAQELRSLSDKSLGALRLAVADNEVLRDALRFSEDAARPERKVLFYVAVYQHLRERIRQDIIRTDDPIDAIEEMEVELARLSGELTLREKRLVLSSESVANIIKKTILREQNRIRTLNQGLSNITFGQVKGVRLNIDILETHIQLLMGLSDNAEHHQDLFSNNKLSFSESMAKVYQRVNPHIDLGQRSLQVFGEELLDYRNYLALSIEVNRGTDGWLKAESGALSTGEAIGTGQAILLMVVQSWEEESKRFRAKNIVPCRLLFLDEAARLDAKSISTLFELCHRLNMQLLIAAPENISPEQGTTYKLVRKIFNNKEQVHVVGLKGFAESAKELIPS